MRQRSRSSHAEQCGRNHDRTPQTEHETFLGSNGRALEPALAARAPNAESREAVDAPPRSWRSDVRRAGPAVRPEATPWGRQRRRAGVNASEGVRPPARCALHRRSDPQEAAARAPGPEPHTPVAPQSPPGRPARPTPRLGRPKSPSGAGREAPSGSVAAASPAPPARLAAQWAPARPAPGEAGLSTPEELRRDEHHGRRNGRWEHVVEEKSWSPAQGHADHRQHSQGPRSAATIAPTTPAAKKSP